MADKDNIAAGGTKCAPPKISTARQKTFITDNAGILDKNSTMTILSIVMMEVGPVKTEVRDGAEVSTGRRVVYESPKKRGVSIHLDNIDNPGVIDQIYNIVANRRAVLDKPASRA